MIFAILLAGSVGFGASQNIFKQFVEVNSKPVLTCTIEKFLWKRAENNMFI